MASTPDIFAAYQQAKTRLLLLDYDGTLTEFAPTPPEARPGQDLLDLLVILCADQRNTVVIVSGRDQKTLEEWLGHLPLTLVAEHGHFLKRPGQPWSPSGPTTDTWKASVRAQMEAATLDMPGTFTEEKSTALVWHYRQPAQAADHAAALLSVALEPLAQNYGLRVVPGNKMVEVRQAGADKGKVAGEWALSKNWDFMLAAGDDTTDEDLFKAMPPAAHTIKIGPGTTAAKVRLDSPAALVELLKSFVLKSK